MREEEKDDNNNAKKNMTTTSRYAPVLQEKSHTNGAPHLHHSVRGAERDDLIPPTSIEQTESEECAHLDHRRHALLHDDDVVELRPELNIK